jgi:hypothetical protein
MQPCNLRAVIYSADESHPIECTSARLRGWRTSALKLVGLAQQQQRHASAVMRRLI